MGQVDSANRDDESRGRAPRIFALGEVLWDVFPSGTLLGGASANVAVHAARLGAESSLSSRVGKDELGRRALRRLALEGVDVGGVGLDATRPTGTVGVHFGADGEPRYEIRPGVAWDRIAIDERTEARLLGADVLCLGTLAQRTPLIAGRVKELLGRLRRRPRHARPLVLLDLNLRPPFTERATILGAIAAADVVKLNESEWRWVEETVGAPPLPWLLAHSEIQLVALTLGARGASLFGRHVSMHAPGRPAVGGDPVGAGDAFVAALALGLGRRLPLPRVLELANGYGAWVAGAEGALPMGSGPAWIRAGLGVRR